MSYDHDLRTVLDSHAPIVTSSITERPDCKWFTKELGTAKTHVRHLEKTMKQSGLTVHAQIHADAALAYNKSRTKRKREYFNKLILESAGDQGALFGIADRLLQKNMDLPLPSHDSPTDLSSDFATFFVNKVTKIQTSLVVPSADSIHPISFPEPEAKSSLSEFATLTCKQVADLISSSPIKSCALDPIPADIFRVCSPSLLPALTSIINLSLLDGAVPTQLKGAQLIPILKKHNLDVNELNNYRPISNLPYISKLVERAVASQLSDYMTSHDLHEPLQSAYREAHSTETTITYVLNDLLVAMDEHNLVYVSLLDCSAAFDLVDHHVLLRRLNHRLGISGKALNWFESYLTDRTQCVSVCGAKSSDLPLTCGVPQGSTLGPKLFTIYKLPVGDIIWKHDTGFHLYADDTQVYLACKRADGAEAHKKTCRGWRTALQKFSNGCL